MRSERDMAHPPVVIAEPGLRWTRTLGPRLRAGGADLIVVHSSPILLNAARLLQPKLIVIDEEIVDIDLETLLYLVRDRSADSAVALLTDSAQRLARAEEWSTALRLETCCGKPPSEEALARLLAAVRVTPPPDTRPLIMCVDDEPLFLRALARLLRRHGYRVVTYEDPDRALEAVPEVAPDLAIVDLVMPGMDGRHLAGEIIKNSEARVPVFVLTGQDDDASAQDAADRGVRAFLCKPCDPDELLAAVGEVVGPPPVTP